MATPIDSSKNNWTWVFILRKVQSPYQSTCLGILYCATGGANSQLSFSDPARFQGRVFNRDEYQLIVDHSPLLNIDQGSHCDMSSNGIIPKRISRTLGYFLRIEVPYPNGFNPAGARGSDRPYGESLFPRRSA